MAIKAIHDTASPNGLVLILLAFRVYLCISKYDAPAPTMTQHAAAIKDAMKELRRVRTEGQVANDLNQRNKPGPIGSVDHHLLLNSDVLVWQEGNSG